MSTDVDTSQRVGTVATLRRYPVKSLQGFEVASLEVGEHAIAGDRRRALVDGETGRLMSAKRFSRLLEASADDDGISLPDGRRVLFADPDADAQLGSWLGRPVQLQEASSATHVSYQMTFDPPDDGAEYFDIPSPDGTFLDLAAVHLVSSGTLAGCHAEHPELDWDVRRFRPNVVVEGPTEAFAEDGWCGQRVRIGDVVLAARQPTVRCAMPLRAQPGLDRQPTLYRALDALHANHLGIYLDVVVSGTIRSGDEVELAGPIEP
jgi:uncharacterized protein YcbX